MRTLISGFVLISFIAFSGLLSQTSCTSPINTLNNSPFQGENTDRTKHGQQLPKPNERVYLYDDDQAQSEAEGGIYALHTYQRQGRGGSGRGAAGGGAATLNNNHPSRTRRSDAPWLLRPSLLISLFFAYLTFALLLLHL